MDKVLVTIASNDFYEEKVLQEFSCPSLRKKISAFVFKSFERELDSVDLCLVPLKECESNVLYDGFYVGSAKTLESKLGLALYEINHTMLCIDSSPGSEDSWFLDQTNVSSYLLPLSTDTRPAISDVVEACADEVLELLKSKSLSILITCTSGNEYSCAVGITVLSKYMSTDTSNATKIMVNIVAKL